ncbi:Aste57867_16862 [Aphanomyces stellatus]|uniref:Aste57867_16862 protein n=1 Tax=Aphanomyces stellatus TaxID=120398 RepID=A0A485L6S0_9STRA|nr:hypothetical protein As57867_016804 [Aphanomyces stellatus]VFT93626.1 Aste57867_16862 [Aphanomyces stellatus]
MSPPRAASRHSTQDRPPPPRRLSQEELDTLDAAMARAMQASGMPFDTFVRPAWVAFFYKLNPNYTLPTPDRLKSLAARQVNESSI